MAEESGSEESGSEWVTSAVVGSRRSAPRQWAAGFGSLPKPLRITTYVAIGLVLLLIATSICAVVLVRRSFPQTSGTIAIPGLESEVEVIRDDRGIAQIYADTTEDLMRAQGFVHAQDRFFEMDVRRHATAGRLAEMFGKSAVETDVYVRTMGWRAVAAKELALIKPETRAALTAYAAGVNAYLEDRSLSQISLEYAVLDVGGNDYHPDDWTPVDSLAWLKAMAWDLRGNMAEEIGRSLVAAEVGPKRMRQLYPDYPFDTHQPIVGQGVVVDDVFEQDATEGGSRNPRRPAPFGKPALDQLTSMAAGVDRIPELLGRGDALGSNSWVVDGEHTSTGAPLLANDTHLGVSMPGVWTQIGLHCRAITDACPYDVAGYSFSGVPGVVIGHNADIAWGFTNLGPDVTDLFVEQVAGDTWRYGDEWLPVTSREETIKVAGGDDVEITVRSTDHGPLLSDVDDELAEVGLITGSPGESPIKPPAPAARIEYAVALSWTALRPRPTADAILQLDRARDPESFRSALSSFAAPGQNVIYADRAGHIGYQATGEVPIRRSGNDGTMPAAGWRPENDWTGDFVDYQALPNLWDPDEGFIATANQAVIGPDYPYALSRDWDQGYRSQRIRELLTRSSDGRIPEGGELSMADMLDLQRDTRHPLAQVLTPYLLEVELPRRYWDDGQELLREWDFEQGIDSAGAAYFNVVWRNLLALTFHDELPESQWPQGGQRWYAVVESLLDRADDPWWDDVETEAVESREDIMEQAMRDARDELTSRQSPDAEEWRWGGLHQLELRSSTLGESGIGAIEALFNRGGWEVAGGGGAVDASAWNAVTGYQVTAAPAMRMVVDLDELDESRWINLTGVSGHAFHDHYTDQTDLWARGDTLPWLFSRDAVQAAGQDVLRLVPEE